MVEFRLAQGKTVWRITTHSFITTQSLCHRSNYGGNVVHVIAANCSFFSVGKKDGLSADAEGVMRTSDRHVPSLIRHAGAFAAALPE
jgi:hypothetical protein